MTTILWDLDTDDWAAGSSETLETVQKTYEDFVAMGSNGTFKNSGQIVLTHEIDNTTMTLAMEFLPKIRAAYKNVLDVATCMNITNPYHESQVTMIPFNATEGSTSSAAPASSTAAAVSSAAAAVASDATETPAANAASSAAAIVNNASTSAGIQVGPNGLLMAAFAVAAYFF